MEIFLFLVTLALGGTCVFLYQKIRDLQKRPPDHENPADTQKIISDLHEKINEFSSRNITWAGQYQELSGLNEKLLDHVDGLNGKINDLMEKQAGEIKAARLDANQTQRAILRGKISEEIAPILPGWKYNVSDARFYGAPIDFLIVRGMSEDNITELIFLDVKTNNAPLTSRQRQIRDCIENGKVSWDTFRIHDKIFEVEEK